jgi:hypothetical protein
MSRPQEAWHAGDLRSLYALDPALLARRGKDGVATLLAAIEDEVARAPAPCFHFDERGAATLSAAGRSYAAGRFTTPTLGELRARVAARARAGGRLLLTILRGVHPRADIGTLQATAPPGTLFQVASQFNCLEAPGPRIVPVRAYVTDPTQGPRASVSAFPGTFLRHYHAPDPDGGRFVQSDARCLNLLGEVAGGAVAEVRSGYLRATQVKDLGALAEALVERFDRVRVGVHDGVEVVLGHDWGGAVPAAAPRIAQVFTSTMDLGGHRRADGEAALATARRQLLRAAYLGTLLAALDLGSEAVVLTLIGGGVFANPQGDIWDALHWALAETDPLCDRALPVIVNARESEVGPARARGGVVVDVDPR